MTIHDRPVVSVVLCTLNRRALLEGALDALVRQQDAPAYEVLLVDNGSTDGTAVLADAVRRRFPSLRYLLEPRRGLAHARNAGVALARGAYIAFTDDDVRVAPDWVRTIADAFAAAPRAACVGGPVLPQWPAAPPAWLTRDHWAPLALVDYGPDPLVVSHARPLCLVGANVAFRAEPLAGVGLFDPLLQRVGDGVGSVEDHDLLIRLWDAGGHGVYWPALKVVADVQAERLTLAYHRRWHRGHGRFCARMGWSLLEATGLGTVLGVPAHMYRRATTDAAVWVRSRLLRAEADALAADMRLQFFAGFMWERIRRGAGGRKLRLPLSGFRRVARGGSRSGPGNPIDPDRIAARRNEAAL